QHLGLDVLCRAMRFGFGEKAGQRAEDLQERRDGGVIKRHVMLFSFGVFPGRSAARSACEAVRCRAGAVPDAILSSCAGLTRASISLREILSNKMDGRVKPGHDGSVF